MSKVTLEKTHALLEKLTNYVMSEVSKKSEVKDELSQVNSQFEQVNNKIDKLATYVMNEVPTNQKLSAEVDGLRNEMNNRFEKVESELKETKQDVKSILNGMDNQVKDMEILRTEQIAIHSGLRRLENRVDGLERKRA